MISSALQWFTYKTILPLDLKFLEDFGPTLIKSLIYSGANPWIALKVDTNILNDYKRVLAASKDHKALV